MENENKKEKKGKKIFRTLGIIAITAGVCYEIFGRKNQDVKNAYGWVKGKIQSRKTTTNNRVENNQNRPNNNNQSGGNWNNKRKN